MSSQELRTSIIHFCHRMDRKGWVSNHDGNISVRCESGFVATPTARSKADLKEKDLLEVDVRGQRTGGASGSVFSEFAVHSRVFAARSDVMAVVHAHPPHATAVGCAQQEMLTTAIPEAVISLGPGIPLVGLALPQSQELWNELDPLLAYYDAVLVAGNGVFSWGTTLEQAFLRLELIEHIAEISLKSLSLGGPKLLAPEQVRALLKKREAAGLARPADPARPHWFP